MSDVDAQTLRASYCTMPYGLQEGTVAAREAWEFDSFLRVAGGLMITIRTTSGFK